MCVIAVCEYARLSDEQVTQMWEANSFGGGVAWRERRADDTPIVKWKKGLLKDDMVRLNNELPLPYVLHFRQPSPDTSKALMACHPFAISGEAEFEWEGETTGSVLFHNGHWNGWREAIKGIAIAGFVQIPDGPWSDSRGLAWAANHLGLGFLEMVNEKVVVFGPNDEDISIYNAGAWPTIDLYDDKGNECETFVSNKTWERTTYPHPTRPHQSHQTTTTSPAGGTETNITSLVKREQSGGAAANAQSFQAGRHNIAGTGGVTEESQEERANRKEEIQQAAERAREKRTRNLDLNAAVGTIYQVCSSEMCRKILRDGGQILNGRHYCWQCWSDRTQEHRKANKLVGTCQTCDVNLAGARRFSNDEWICHACWETYGRPKIVYVMGDKADYD